MSHKLFLSWSGQLSRDVAGEFHQWIPSVLQSVSPFLSAEDIEKGERWSMKIAGKLEETGSGLVILTKQNLEAPWIMFEAGALSKLVGKSQVAPVLIDVPITEVRSPLNQFQATQFNKSDVFKLIRSINKACPAPINEENLKRSFEALWPQFEDDVNNLVKKHAETSADVREPEVTLESVGLSVSELIQSVQQIRSDMRRSGQNNIPSGLITDLEEVQSIIDENLDTDGDIFIVGPPVKNIRRKLKLITGYLRRQRSPSYRGMSRVKIDDADDGDDDSL